MGVTEDCNDYGEIVMVGSCEVIDLISNKNVGNCVYGGVEFYGLT